MIFRAEEDLLRRKLNARIDQDAAIELVEHKRPDRQGDGPER